jgi:hypothetical protein
MDSSTTPVASGTTPSVISTYPANGADGPFALYVPGGSEIMPHFTIRFNNIMDASTFTLNSVTCKGFNIPVRVSVLYAPLNSTAMAFSVKQVGTTLMPAYLVNTTYSITINTSVEDKKGRPLDQPYTFNFMPEPYLRVLNVAPAANSTTVLKSEEVFFNGKLSGEILNAVAQASTLPNKWSISGATDSTSLIDNFYGASVPSQSYTVVVPQGVHDRYGNVLQNGVSQAFVNAPLIINYDRTINGSSQVSLAKEVSFSFNFPMDVTSMKSAVTVTPGTPLIFLTGENTMSFYGSYDLLQDTDYAVTVSTGLRTMSGYHIPEPITLHFHTALFTVSHYPEDGATNVSIQTPITFSFTGAIDPITLEDAIQVSPAYDHVFLYSRNDAGKVVSMDYVPKMDSLAYNTTYTVSLSDTFRSVGGYKLPKPVLFTFTTMKEQPKQ